MGVPDIAGDARRCREVVRIGACYGLISDILRRHVDHGQEMLPGARVQGQTNGMKAGDAVPRTPCQGPPGPWTASTQRPLKTGLRFSAKAFQASWVSSVWASAAVCDCSKT